VAHIRHLLANVGKRYLTPPQLFPSDFRYSQLFGLLSLVIMPLDYRAMMERATLYLNTMICFRPTRWLQSLAVGVLSIACAAEEPTIKIQNVRSGTATLRQQGRLTVLEINSRNRRSQRIALSHPSDYRQGTAAPYEAHVVAENPNHFLIFTDTFASNPGNEQSQCGASPTGERFIHIVALGALPHETLSVLIESCLLDVEPHQQSPEWIADADSSGFKGRLILSFESGSQPTAVYFVSPDGTVSRPQTGQDSSKAP
jgi:hypothetical protein